MRRWAHRTHLAGWLLSLAFLGSCRPASDRPATATSALTVTDDAGRSVTLPAPARRIVSLAPSSTELLFAIGAGKRLVGRTTWCRYPPAVLAIPVVGDGLNPNIEAVAARRPDLVVLYRSQLNETAAEQLVRLGIPAVILRQDRLEDVARDARLLGVLAGHPAAGDSIAAALEAVAAAPTPAPVARLAFVVWDNPPMVIGAGSFLDQLAGLAGGANVFHDIATASAVVSLETVAARNPDMIVVLEEGDSAGLPAYSARREWQAIRAVRERRFVFLPGVLFGRPSPRAAEAVAEFRRRLLETK
ncbi:MAG: ABC transporter substrate-binding protein [Gemmatimonadetes bacterium]|nr:ABC transporter substrate-binding protein [Gemmatimonadota bacterium]